LGRAAAGEWRLVGFEGSATLHADERGATLLGATAGDVTVNDEPLLQETRLHDGDRLRFGPYLFRYENLLHE
jgi:hypothetical protein